MSKKSKLSALSWKGLIAVAAVMTLSILALFLTPHPTDEDASAMYLVEDDGLLDVDELTQDVFLTDGNAELVSRKDGNDLKLTADQAVSVLYHGEVVSSTVSRAETVTQLLRRLRIHPSPLEMVTVAFLEDSTEIRIDSELVFYERSTEVKEHEVIYKSSRYKPVWEETVLQEGRDGEHTEVYEVIYQDGEEISRQLIQSTDTEPVPAIIEKGTVENFANNDDAVSNIQTNEDGSGVITLENGHQVTFHSTRTMRGTAYTAFENPLVNDITATGTKVRLGVVAVDRRTIPLGTKLYVVSNDGRYQYGFSIAEDTGVRGNIIDLYMNTYEECIQFGARDCTVYILD